MSFPQRISHSASTSPAPRQHLRIHQPHDVASESTGEGAGSAVSHSRHELADVVQQVACRLRQHVASATMHSNMLAKRLGADARNMAILDEVVRSVRTLETLVDGLSDYASDAAPQFEALALKPLLDEVLSAMQDQCQRQKVSVERSIPANLCMEADRRQLAAALRHLTYNALASMPAGGELVVTAVATSNGVEIEVGDSGPGLSGTELAHPFAPLRHQAAPGSGLERAICQQVVSAHGGKATARNCPEGGTALTLIFPARQTRHAVA